MIKQEKVDGCGFQTWLYDDVTILDALVTSISKILSFQFITLCSVTTKQPMLKNY